MLLNTWSGLNSWRAGTYSTVADAIMGLTGLGVAEGWGQIFSKTAGEHMQDAEKRWLLAQGATLGQLDDMWTELHGPGDIGQIKLNYLNNL